AFARPAESPVAGKERNMMVRTMIAAALTFPVVTLGQTGYSISGGMSNFDVHNRSDTPCNEFEIEIDGVRPEDVVHTYGNPNYGAPTVTLGATGLSTVIDYRNPHHSTAVNTLEHFGVSLRSLAQAGQVRVRWMVNGEPATVNGVVPTPAGDAPATQPVMPSITAGTAPGNSLTCTVSNNDAASSIWVKRRAVVRTGGVTLEQLMTDNPVVTSTLAIDAAPFRLAPGASVTSTRDLIESEDNQSVVFAAEYFQDIISGGPFGGSQHVFGPALGNVMTASTAALQTCADFRPTITTQPLSTTVDLGASVDLRVVVQSDEDPQFQWMKDGQPIAEGGVYHGTTTDGLSIDEIVPQNQGFYQVKVWNACGWSLSDSALVFVRGLNNPPARPNCGADMGGVGADDSPDGVLDNNDFIVFIGYFFDGKTNADIGQAGGQRGPDMTLDNNDFIAFIDMFFGGC
ncbi:MAG: immunoglobulin domain-containing protein, partial [Phycisphaerales bacterium]|nr:immunoglobulin domain-containing protein [Phycisphaerales bacterium]